MCDLPVIAEDLFLSDRPARKKTSRLQTAHVNNLTFKHRQAEGPKWR